MPGIIIAVVIAVFALIFGGTTTGAYLSATGFLWTWYWIWTVLLGVIVGLMALAATGFFSLAGAEVLESRAGAFLGLAAGGAISLLWVAFAMSSRVLLLIGAHLMMTAGTPEMNLADFSSMKLILGLLLIFFGIGVFRIQRTLIR